MLVESPTNNDGVVFFAVPSRLMICCLMFFAIVVSNSYTANMTAFLTMRKSEDLPQTLQALAAQTAINYSYVKVGIMHHESQTTASALQISCTIVDDVTTVTEVFYAEWIGGHE
jgi:hypothetical protein